MSLQLASNLLRKVFPNSPSTRVQGLLYNQQILVTVTSRDRQPVKKGTGPPSVRSYIFNESIYDKIVTSNSPVMDPLGDDNGKYGTCLPRKVQVGPDGKYLPFPKFFPSSKLMSPMSSFSGVTVMSIPATQFADTPSSFSDAKITTQSTGSPVAAVTPKTVKCLSLLDTFCFGVVPLPHTYFSPPL
jgi:hypothetical protein